jgi:hypothetical protein
MSGIARFGAPHLRVGLISPITLKDFEVPWWIVGDSEIGFPQLVLSGWPVIRPLGKSVDRIVSGIVHVKKIS